MSNADTRAILYQRVSTDEQGEKGYSLTEQGAVNRAHAEARSYQIVGTFDEDFTGTVSSRPEMGRILGLAAAGAFDVLICANMDRLARGNRPRYTLEDTLTAHAIRVEFVEETYEDSAEGELQKDIKGSITGYQVRDIARKTSKGRYRKAKDNGVTPTGCRVFGYRTITSHEAAALPEFAGRAGELLPHPEQAETLRELFSRAIAGHSLRALAEWLDSTDHRPPQSGGNPCARWHSSTVRFILRNPIYIGQWAFGRQRHTCTKELTASGARLRKAITPAPAGRTVPISTPPLIDADAFTRAQAALQANKARHASRQPRSAEEWPLQGIVFCSQCTGRRGQPLRATPNARRATRFFICQSRFRPEMDFCGTQHRADELEAAALDTLQFLATPGLLAEQERARAEAQRAAHAAANPQDPAAVLRACDEAETGIAKMIAAGISEHIWQAQLTACHNRRAAALAALAAAAAQFTSLPDPATAAARGAAAQQELAQLLARGPQGVRAALRKLRIAIGGPEDPTITLG